MEVVPELVKEGRRESDWRIRLVGFVESVLDGEQSVFFWVFGIFLESKPPHKPSMTRLALAAMLVIGWRLFGHEILLRDKALSLQNAVWTAWQYTTIAFAVAVVAPGTFGKFATGSIGDALKSISTSARDVVQSRRAEASAVPHDPGDPVTEYTGAPPMK